jgi:arylsulfatase A
MSRSLVITLCLALSVVSRSELLAKDLVTPPNIVFVLADDLGWAELGCYGNGFNETPNLDRLAGGGMRFTQAYAAAPVCSPYRAAFLTGQHPARIGILDYLRPNSANALSTHHVTLPETLQRSGYSTGMVGKWHLTGYEFHKAEHEVKPREHGFGWDFAREVKGVGNGANFWPYVFRDQPIRWLDIPKNRLGDDEFLVDRMNLEAVDFIERNKDQPFFLYLSHYAPHSILNGKSDLVEKYRKKHSPGKSSRTRCYLCQDHGHKGDLLNHWAEDHNPHLAAMLESIDDGIGQISKRLEELGLADNTIFIFTSDNGGETNVTSNAPLRGGKSQLYEGGIRVPLIVRWPIRIPANTVSHQPTVNVDFYPTLLESADVKADPKQTLDGVSTLASWKDPSAKTGRDTLYWHYPLDRPHFLGGESAGAIREGDWKLIENFDTGKAELYSLKVDLSEKQNIAVKHPEKVTALKHRLAAWRNEIGARIPSPPLLTEPRQLEFADHFSPGQVSDRWHFNKDWSAENGVLQRGQSGGENTRIFLKDAKFRDVMIRFDFQLQKSQDIRLVTGGSGHYNAVIHIRPDHFYVQTALDETGPYFSYRHGECAFNFDPDRWYTMTVEFIGDELVAHLDRDHLAYAKHPILDKERRYFAFQVDNSPAAFDNVQILRAEKHSQQADNRKHILAATGKHPVAKPVQEQFAIQKSNAHEWFYQRHEAYRDLVKRVDELDEENKKLYPEVFRTHKEFQKEISKLRKKLHEEDPKYKETLFATFRAARAIEAFLIVQQPDVADLPDSQRKAQLERLRKKHQKRPEYLKLVAGREAAQQKLEQDYPQLFLTNEQISERKSGNRKAIQKDPEFKKRIDLRAAAYRAQQDYLFEHDKKLKELGDLIARERTK